MSPGPVVFDLHSNMRQKERLTRMERFRRSTNAILVCTDIAARGLDVPDVAAVIHFQTPRAADVFGHRSGRTARAGQSGESVAFKSPSDASQWRRLYHAVGIPTTDIADVRPTANEVAAAK